MAEAKIRIGIDDRTKGPIERIKSQLGGLGRGAGFGGFTSLLKGGLILGALAMAARSAARAVGELVENARKTGDFSAVSESDVNTIEMMTESVGRLKKAITAALAEKTALLLRGVGVGAGVSDAAMEQMRAQLAEQRQQRIDANKLIYDALPLTEKLAIAENKLTELRKRGVSDAKSYLDVTKQQLAVDNLRVDVIKAQGAARVKAMDMEIASAGIDRQRGEDAAKVWGQYAEESTAEALRSGHAKPYKIDGRTPEQREKDETRKRLEKLAYVSPTDLRREAMGTYTPSDRVKWARAALGDLDRADSGQATADAAAAVIREIEEKKESVEQQVISEIADLHATIKSRLGVAK